MVFLDLVGGITVLSAISSNDYNSAVVGSILAMMGDIFIIGFPIFSCIGETKVINSMKRARVKIDKEYSDFKLVSKGWAYYGMGITLIVVGNVLRLISSDIPALALIGGSLALGGLVSTGIAAISPVFRINEARVLIECKAQPLPERKNSQKLRLALSLDF